METEGVTGGASRPSGGSRAEQLARILAECSDRLNAGEELDAERVIASYPELASDLKIALDALQRFDSSVRAERPRSVLGDFRLLRELGRGGMGIVYEAWQASMDRQVALKVLPASLLAKPKAVTRFEREARVAGRLHHPNIVSVHGMGIESGSPYFAMEFVEGETLEQVLARVRQLDGQDGGGSGLEPLSSLSQLFDAGAREQRAAAAAPAAPEAPPAARRDPGLESSFDAEEINLKYCLGVAEAFAGVAEGLQHAHQKGVVHRDLKPSNLILDRKGRLRILDFGLARLEGQQSLTLSGELLGTPLYMSPEQAMAHRAPVDHRTDIYSFGATLYEMLVRRPPFRGKDYKETLSQIVSREPPPPRRLNHRIPRNLETIVLKCLRKDPAGRYGTAEALAQDLRRFVRGDPIEARPQPALEKLARSALRHKWGSVAVGSLTLLLLASALLVREYAQEARAARNARYDRAVIGAIVKIQRGRPAAPPLHREAGRSSARGTPEERGSLPLAHAEELESPETAWPDPVAEAAAELAGAIELDPGRAEARYHRARALRLLGREDEALRELTLALDAEPRFVPAGALRRAILDGREAPAARGEGGRGGKGDWTEAWLRAHQASARKDWKEAAAAYTQLLELSPASRGGPFAGASLEARLGRGAARLETGDLDGALEDFAALKESFRDLPDPDLLRGKTYLLKGNEGRAGEIFEDLHARDLPGGEAALRIAATFRECGGVQPGLDWAERAAESPARERVRSDFLLRLGRQDDALRAAERAVELDPGDSRSHVHLGSILTFLGNFDRAEEAFARALARNPREADAHYGAAQLLLWRKDLHAAVDGYRRALELDPRHHRARVNLGSILARLERYPQAVAEFQKAIEADDSWLKSPIALGEALAKEGKHREAAAEYRKAFKLEVNRALAWVNRGLRLGNQGKIKDARAAFETAVAIDPAHPEPHFNLGNVLRDQRQPAAAAAEYEAAIRLDPKHARAHNNLAALREQEGDFIAARAGYRRALEADPRYFAAHNNLGVLSMKERDLPAAAAAFQSALEIEPGYVKARANLGLALAKAGNFKEAAAQYARVVKEVPGHLDAREKLALALEKSGEAEKAIAVCEEALGAFGADPERGGLLRALARLLKEAGRGEEARRRAAEGLALRRERADRPEATAAEINDCARGLLECEVHELQDPRIALDYARRAVTVSGERDPGILHTLALALFRGGDAALAARTAEKALQLLPPRGKAALRQEIEGDLARWKGQAEKPGDAERRPPERRTE